MRDPRNAQLAKVVVSHSLRVEPGEVVLIEAIDLPDPTLVCRLVELAATRGANPFVTWKNNSVLTPRSPSPW